MTRALLTAPASPPRWRRVLAAFALVGALVATASAMPANADEVGSGPGTISGTVTTEDGQPLEGTTVLVTFVGSTTTDADGHYELSGLELEEYQVSTWAPGYDQPQSQQAVLTEESPTATVDFVLVPFAVGIGTISGIVSADGVPLAGQNVSVHSFAAGQSLNTLADENGYYQFTDLVLGDWMVYAWAGSQYQPVEMLTAHLTDDAPAAIVDVHLISWPVGTATIGGIVTDSATGEPIEGVTVSVSGVDVAHNSSVTTDDSGAFSFDLLPAGKYYLNLWMSGYLSVFEEIQVLDGQSVTFDRALVSTNSTISGHVEGPDGSPVVGMDIHASTGDSGGWAVTDENGDYVISQLGALSYTVSLGGVGTPYELEERVVTAVADADVTADFTLTNRTTGFLSGMVFGPGGGFYNQPVCATLYSAKSKKPLAHTVTENHSGNGQLYFFDNLNPGTYTVEFRDCDDDPATTFEKVFLGGVKKFKDATFVTITAGLDSFGNNVTLTLRGNH